MLADYQIKSPVAENEESGQDDLQEKKDSRDHSGHPDLIKYVSETALELLKPLSYREILQVIADRLQLILDEAILFVSEYEPSSSTLIIREIRGPDDQKEILGSMLGREVKDMPFPFPEEIRTRMQPGALDHLEGGLFDLAFGQIPAPLCRQIEERLKIRSVYAMACTVDNDILGTVSFLLHNKKLKAQAATVIESIVSQASLALKRSRVESSLLESHQRYDSLFQNATIAIQHCKIITDDKGTPVDYEMFRINNTMTRLTGLTEEMVYKKRASEVFPLITSSGFIKKFGKIAVEGGELNDEFYVPRLDKWFSVYAYSPLKGEFTAFFSDITERKNHELELRKAKEKAEESDRLKTVFLANISHEIRTPMNGIMGFAELLMKPGLSEESQKKYLEAINLSSRRMLGIINDLLAISRIETGQVEIKKSRTSIPGLLNEVEGFFRYEAEVKGIRLVVSCPQEEDFFIDTDRQKIYQVICNLVSNSLKFTPAGGTIELGCMEQDAHSVSFYVKDTGTGISDDLKDHIFEIFRQGDLAMRHEGVGLGLAIAKAFVELLGGKIGVETEPGKGSTFYLKMPR